MSATEPRSRRIDWDTCPLKHLVRHRGWLPACEARHRRVATDIKKKRRKSPLKYFTFCASNAIDVFMLASAGIVTPSRDSLGFDTVYFIEKDPTEYDKIVGYVSQNGFLGSFEEIVLCERPGASAGTAPPDGGPKGELVREKHRQLREAFPFDVINLDPWGPFFPPKRHTISPLLEAYRCLLEWQKQEDREDAHRVREFTLLLTCEASPDRTNADALSELLERLERNCCDSLAFRQAFERRFSGLTPSAVQKRRFPEFFAAALPKVLVRDAIGKGWRSEYRGVYLYHRPKGRGTGKHIMMSSVTHFSRIDEPGSAANLMDTPFRPNEAAYYKTTAEVLGHGFCDCNTALEDPDTQAEIGEHLARVVKCRERFIGTGAIQEAGEGR